MTAPDACRYTGRAPPSRATEGPTDDRQKAGDVGIKTVYDLKGKRIAWVLGAPALNLNMTAYLAAGNLTWNDVQKSEFPSRGAAARALIEGKADCFIASTNSGPVYELANSPRRYAPAAMPDPKEDPGAWERLRRWGPYLEANALLHVLEVLASAVVGLALAGLLLALPERITTVVGLVVAVLAHGLAVLATRAGRVELVQPEAAPTAEGAGQRGRRP